MPVASCMMPVVARDSGTARRDRGAMAIVLVPAWLLAHAAVIAWLPRQAGVATFAFLVGAPLVAAAACLVHGRRPGAERGRWLAFAFALLLWAGGMAAAMAGGVLHGEADAVTAASIALFVLYGVPLAFALASRGPEPPAIRAVDAALAVALGALFTAHTFAYAGRTWTDAAGIVHLRRMLDVENAFVLAFALLRWACAYGAGLRAFFGVLARYALAYAAVATYVNHYSTDAYGSFSDLLIDAPFLLLAVDALRPPPTGDRRGARAAFARVVRIASPLILPIALLAISILLLPHQPRLAAAGFCVATLGYGIRSVLVQLESGVESRRLARLAGSDPLTGLANRRQFDERLALECRRATRGATALALVLVDIDHFKRLNDTFGHPAGDAWLLRVGTALAAEASRGGDLVARYGGEEFAVILPDTSVQDAARIAERMRATVAGMRAGPGEAAVAVTISAGVAGVEDTGAEGDPHALVRAADVALYRAKRGGRNRVAGGDPG